MFCRPNLTVYITIVVKLDSGIWLYARRVDTKIARLVARLASSQRQKEGVRLS